jgi:tetratricopeptide (TPR) repeat protein
MSTELFLSRFTPSMMSADVLEKVLVQRGDLASRLVEVIRESVLTPSKHHTLVIGSRGIGKTHLLSLVQNRIAGQQNLAERVRIAWLREEEWGVASFLDFLYRILRALAARYQDDALRDETETLFSLPLKTAERRAADLLRSFIEGRTLLLIAENLDSVFQGLAKKGQQRLRAYLQEESSWTILASSQALFAGVALYESPFYGFFDIHHLQELSIDDAALLVQNIAELANDSELALYVQTEAGRARIRAVHHLAGGNHRVYMILSEFLTRDSLDQLIDPFLRMMDDLTPYYQARMEQLSPQQRKIVDLLCSVRGAVPVKEIAKRCFITSQTASSQLKDLRDRGYVGATPVGRDAYYELAEPLMRLAMEVKNQRNGHVRLFLDFLRHWYGRPELVDMLARTPAESTVEREYLEWVLSDGDASGESPELQNLVGQLSRLLATREFSGLLLITQRLVQLRGSVYDWTLLGYGFSMLGKHSEALAALDKALAIDDSYARAWALRSAVYIELGRLEEALDAVTKALARDGSEPLLHAARAAVLRSSKRLGEALQAYDRALEIWPQGVFVWNERTDLLMLMGRDPEALESAERALAIDPEGSRSILQRARVFFRLNRYNDALVEFERVLHRDPADVTAVRGRAAALTALGETGLALKAAWAAHELTPADAMSNWLVARNLVQQGSFAESIPLIDAAETVGLDKHVLLPLRIRAGVGLGRFEEARALLQEMSRHPEAHDSLAITLITDLFRIDSEEPGRERASFVYSTYQQHGLGRLLASSLVAAAQVLVLPGTSIARSRQWVALWRKLTGTDEEFELPLRLLETLITYQDTQDSRILLRLPLEERQIVEEVLTRAREQANRLARLSSDGG